MRESPGAVDRITALRQIVAIVGIVVSIATAITIPVGFAALSYSGLQEELSVKSRLAARRIA